MILVTLLAILNLKLMHKLALMIFAKLIILFNSILNICNIEVDFSLNYLFHRF